MLGSLFGAQIILFRAVRPEMYLQKNIPLTNGKDLVGPSRKYAQNICTKRKIREKVRQSTKGKTIENVYSIMYGLTDNLNF